MKKVMRHFRGTLLKNNDDFSKTVRELENYYERKDVWNALSFWEWRRIFFCAKSKKLRKRAIREMEARAGGFKKWTWVYLAAREIKDNILAKYAQAIMAGQGNKEDWTRVAPHLDSRGVEFARQVINDRAQR